MMTYFLSMGMMMLTMGLLGLMSRFKHLLSLLLSLELIGLSLLTLLASMMTTKNADSMILMTFITLMVCEGSLGLSALVNMSRLTGNTLIISTAIS